MATVCSDKLHISAEQRVVTRLERRFQNLVRRRSDLCDTLPPLIDAWNRLSDAQDSAACRGRGLAADGLRPGMVWEQVAAAARRRDVERYDVRMRAVDADIKRRWEEVERLDREIDATLEMIRRASAAADRDECESRGSRESVATSSGMLRVSLTIFNL